MINVIQLFSLFTLVYAAEMLLVIIELDSLFKVWFNQLFFPPCTEIFKMIFQQTDLF